MRGELRLTRRLTTAQSRSSRGSGLTPEQRRGEQVDSSTNAAIVVAFSSEPPVVIVRSQVPSARMATQGVAQSGLVHQVPCSSMHTATQCVAGSRLKTLPSKRSKLSQAGTWVRPDRDRAAPGQRGVPPSG